MTQVDEETQSKDQAETPATNGESAEAAAPAEATPKAPKSWAERIKTSLENGASNQRYQWFKDFFERESAESIDVDLNTIALVMTLVNPLRQTDEYKAWDVEYRASQGTAGPKIAEPKTPDEIREFAKRAQDQLARQNKAKMNAEARAERAAKLLAQLEAEEAGDDTSAEDEAPDAEEQEDDAF
jgi:hypothetical protein